MNDSPLKPASSRRKKMDKTMMAIYFLILFIVAGAALLAFLCLSKPSDKRNKAGSDPSIASSSTLKNSHQTGTDAKSMAKAKIKEEKPVDPYENLAVANVDDALNLREKPDTDAKVLGTCFRGGGGTILQKSAPVGWRDGSRTIILYLAMISSRSPKSLVSISLPSAHRHSMYVRKPARILPSSVWLPRKTTILY